MSTVVPNQNARLFGIYTDGYDSNRDKERVISVKVAPILAFEIYRGLDPRPVCLGTGKSPMAVMCLDTQTITLCDVCDDTPCHFTFEDFAEMIIDGQSEESEYPVKKFKLGHFYTHVFEE